MGNRVCDPVNVKAEGIDETGNDLNLGRVTDTTFHKESGVGFAHYGQR